MTATFFRLTTDKQRCPLSLHTQFQSAIRPACWLIGSGPSLNDVDWNLVEKTPIPRMTINLAGHGLTRPHIWTAYDPTQRFHKSIYLDASILKLVNVRRATDLIPESTLKVCDAPNVAFFESDRSKGYHNFLSPSASRVIDWNDSFVQAIDLLFQLGFRRIFCLGCELFISTQSLTASQSIPRLREAVKKQTSSQPTPAIDQQLRTRQYHFEEAKPLRAAINTDEHYFRIVQALRLSRTSIASAGMQLISSTPVSRLNDFFPYQSLQQVHQSLCLELGNPDCEQTLGRYTRTTPRSNPIKGQMIDFQPPSWPQKSTPHKQTPHSTQHRKPAGTSQHSPPFDDHAEFSPLPSQFKQQLDQARNLSVSIKEHA